jgi:hypothetical protein
MDEEVAGTKEKKAPKQKKKRVRTEVVESSSSEGEADGAWVFVAVNRSSYNHLKES